MEIHLGTLMKRRPVEEQFNTLYKFIVVSLKRGLLLYINQLKKFEVIYIIIIESCKHAWHTLVCATVHKQG